MGIWQRFSRGLYKRDFAHRALYITSLPISNQTVNVQFQHWGCFHTRRGNVVTNEPRDLEFPRLTAAVFTGQFCSGHSALPAVRHGPRGESEPRWVTEVYAAPLTFMYVYVASQKAQTEVRIRSISVSTFFFFTLRLSSWDKKKPKHLVRLWFRVNRCGIAVKVRQAAEKKNLMKTNPFSIYWPAYWENSSCTNTYRFGTD